MKMIEGFDNQKKYIIVIIWLTTMGILTIYEFLLLLKPYEVTTNLAQPRPKTKAPSITPSSPVFTTSLFGQYNAPRIIPASSLDIHIVGILYDYEGSYAQVILKTENNQELVYGVGDKLPNGAEIKKINKHNVIILYHQRLEKISIKENPLKFDAPSKPLKQHED
ncbi:MAG: hypothetical protein CMF38_06160 [Legionellaceae bacterium]|nr:hypothetical protein [Legionellaceae bacterium]HAF88101.1 hypothetical protein [Legionellales bacterium]HCA90074.1 hypothetical protein [Legionellales bacterium]|tara:strand:+ start:2956 stop:3450 length:495 start_codon:yes stop_codon:yes gene_type:complete